VYWTNYYAASSHGPVGGSVAQPVAGLLTNLFSIKKLLLQSVIAEIATIILKASVSGILRSYFFNPDVLFQILLLPPLLILGSKNRAQPWLPRCRYFINPSQKK
jgi:hypothetical protein